MNYEVDYDRHTANIRKILSLNPAYRGRGTSVDALLESEVPRLLGRVEQRLTAELRASGVSAEAAAHSALFFVQFVAEHFLADCDATAAA